MLLSGYGTFFLFCAGAVVFGIIGIVLSRLIQWRNPGKQKQTTYECGMRKFGDARIQFDVKYYLFAILFLIFDIEAVLLFPWAVAFDSTGVTGLVEVFIFIGILVIGLAFAWKKGVLRWE